MADVPHGSDCLLRTAQLIETLGVGGAENLALQIANAQARSGHSSHLYVLTEPGPLSSRVHPDVHAHYLHYERAPIGRLWRFGPSLLRGYRLIARRVHEDRVALVQTHLPGANFWGLVLALQRDCRVVATVHNNQEFLYGDADNPVRVRLRREAYRQILRRCQATVAVSEEVRLSLIRQLGIGEAQACKLVTILNGVDIPEPLTPEAREAIRHEYGIPVGTPLVLAAGRLSEQKNFAVLVESAARLRELEVDCRVLIAGEGVLHSDLKQQIARLGLGDTVTLPGNVARLTELMQGAAVFVLPSLWEGLPLVLLEAMACGLPVVGSRIKGVVDVVEDGRNGRLVEPGDVVALADVIARLLRSPEERLKMGASGRAVVEKQFSFVRVAQEVEDLYRRVLDNSLQTTRGNV